MGRKRHLRYPKKVKTRGLRKRFNIGSISILCKAVNRKQLSHVFNNEIKNLNLGSDGKTFDNISKAYRDNFKEQLVNLIK